jgi:hypothetical protein
MKSLWRMITNYHCELSAITTVGVVPDRLLVGTTKNPKRTKYTKEDLHQPDLRGLRGLRGQAEKPVSVNSNGRTIGYRLAAIMIVALLLGLGVPAPAQAQEDLLPQLRLIRSARFEHAFTSDGRVVLVAQGIKESPERIYLTLKDLEGEHAGRVRELVLYDGVAYLRQDAELSWRRVNPSALTALIPTADLLLLFDGPLSRLPDRTIDGKLTEHYQIWGDAELSDPSQPGFVKVDFFIEAQSRYLHQLQLEAPTVSADGSTRLRGTTIRFFDHDDPTLVVSPPQE